MKKTAHRLGALAALLLILAGCQSGGQDTPAEPEEPQMYEMGDTVTFSTFEITVHAWERTDQIALNSIADLRPDAGTQFIVLQMSMTNAGEIDRVAFPSTVYASDVIASIRSGEEVYYPSLLHQHDDDLKGQKFKPGETREGLLAFILPDEAAQADELLLSFEKGSKEYVFALTDQ